MVFVGPYEHHSNELPWRETYADVVDVGADRDGHLDLADLATQLVRYADRPLRIGSFCAASKVTGILSDTDAIAALLHTHGALAAGAAPVSGQPARRGARQPYPEGLAQGRPGPCTPLTGPSTPSDPTATPTHRSQVTDLDGSARRPGRYRGAGPHRAVHRVSVVASA